MRRHITFGFFMVFAAVSFFGCGGGTSDQSAPNRNQPNMNTRDSNTGNSASNTNPANKAASSVNSNTAVVQDSFWIHAMQGGMAEVELGKLAVSRAQNAEVKKFAQKMIDDHTKANTELKALADKKSAVLPVDIGSGHKSLLDKLTALTGAEFDKAYVEAMVEDHEETVEFFEDKTDDSDADIKAFATKTLPTLKSHLEMIKAIQAKMK